MAATAAGSTDGMSALASIPADLVQLVGWRVLAGDLLDYVRFRAVCRHLRSSTVSPRGRGITDPRFQPEQWMMLPEDDPRHPRDRTGRKRFLNFNTRVFVCPRVPLLKDHRILRHVEGLLLLQQQRHGDQANNFICLLHPLTGDVAKFPPITHLTMCLASTHWNSRNNRLFPWNVSASLSLSVEGVAMLMIMIADMPRVLFAAADDKQWSFSAWSFSQTGTICIKSSQGKLYVVSVPIDTPGGVPQIFQIDPPRQEKISSGFSSYSFPPPKVITACQYQAIIGGPFKLLEFHQ